MLQAQHAGPAAAAAARSARMTRAFEHRRPAHWAFGHYLRIAPPEFALPAPPAAVSRSSAAALAA